MPRQHRSTRLLLILLALLMVQLPTAPTQAATRRLSSLSATSGKVISLLPTPDGSRVVYTAGYDRLERVNSSDEAGLIELYSAPASGGGPAVRFTESFTDTGEVLNFAITPDGSRVIFTYESFSTRLNQLYSVPVSGGTPTLLFSPSPPVTSGADDLSYTISKDSQRVVFAYRVGTPGQKLLYSVSTSGGSAVLLTPYTQNFFGTGTIYVDITPDSSTVVYAINQQSSSANRLYRIPITGGTATELSIGLADTEGVQDFELSPDGSQVVYYAVSGAGSRTMRVPLAGGPNVQLVGKAVKAQFTPDSTTIIYPYSTGSTSALVKMPISGGTPITLTERLSNFFDVKLDPTGSYAVSAIAGTGVYTLVSVKIANGALAPLSTGFAGLSSFNTKISPDGSRVVYSANALNGQPNGLYSVPIVGGAAVRLDNPATTAGGVSDFRIATDSSRVVYSAKITTSTAEELYSVPLGGGSPIKISSPLDPDDDRLFILGIGAGGQAFYTVATGVDQQNQRGTATDTIYGASISGSSEAKIIDRSRAIVSDVTSYSVSPNGGHAIYIADAELDGQFSLYSVALPNGTSVKLSGASAASSPTISDDSSLVLFVESGDLYSVAIGGGAASLLLDVATGSSVSSYQIAGNQVVVLSGSFNTPSQLSRLPLAGGAATLIADSVIDFKVTSDAARVAFTTPLNSNSSPSKQLSIALLSGGDPAIIPASDVASYELSPDGTQVVYFDNGFPSVFDPGLYIVPAIGGTPTPLATAASGSLISSYSISPDSQRVLYTKSENNFDSLMSVPIGGGAATPLVAAPTSASLSYTISPDSARVVYSTLESSIVGGSSIVTATLSSAPISGGAANTIFSGSNGGSLSFPYAISDNSASVAFIADGELYSAPIGGTSALKLVPRQGSSRVSSFVISPDSAQIAYAVRGSLFTMPLGGGPSSVIVEPTLPNTGAFDYNFLLNGQLTYLGDLVADDVFHLFIGDAAVADPAFTTTSLTIGEDSGTLNIPVQLSGPASIALDFSVVQLGGTAVAGVDYTLSTPTLSFAAGTTTQTVTLSLIDRPGFSGPRTLTLGLFPGGPALAANEPLATISITISENDPRALYLPLVRR